jgi:serine/threonine protein kinase
MCRLKKCWSDAVNQLNWIENKSSLPQQALDTCSRIWQQLTQKQHDRAALVNLRSFADDTQSSMNLDIRFDMGSWELVDGGNTGAHTSKSPWVGVFKASRRKDGRAFAVKCVQPDDNSPEAIQRMKGEVASHSILLHPCILQYSGDYSISSSHFLKFFLRNQTPQNLLDFSTKYSKSRNCLFIVSEFCSGGSLVQYAHGHSRPNTKMLFDDAVYMAASLVSSGQPSSEEVFLSPLDHHLYADDCVVIFPPGCNNQDILPFVAQVSCRVDGHQFCIRRMPPQQFESSVRQYFATLQLEQNFPDDSFFIHYVCLENHIIHRTLPRPGFAFLRNISFQALSALYACSLTSVYHGDVRLENFLLRLPIHVSEAMQGDDENACSISVQLADFDLATTAKNCTLEFSRDRQQLVIVLCVPQIFFPASFSVN